MSIQVGRPRRKLQRLHTSAPQGLPELLSEQGRPVLNQIPIATQKSVSGAGEIPRHLTHPMPFRLRDDACNFDFSRRQTNHEQDVATNQPRGSPHLGGEEVGGGYDVPLG